MYLPSERCWLAAQATKKQPPMAAAIVVISSDVDAVSEDETEILDATHDDAILLLDADGDGLADEKGAALDYPLMNEEEFIYFKDTSRNHVDDMLAGLTVIQKANEDALTTADVFYAQVLEKFSERFIAAGVRTPLTIHMEVRTCFFLKKY